MTVFICTLFYAYVVIAVNVYRQEILDRANEGYFIRYKVKAPFPVRIMVLFILVAFAVNLFLSIVTGNGETILINVIPALFLSIFCGDIREKSRKSTRRMSDVFLQEKANVDIHTGRKRSSAQYINH